MGGEWGGVGEAAFALLKELARSDYDLLWRGLWVRRNNCCGKGGVLLERLDVLMHREEINLG